MKADKIKREITKIVSVLTIAFFLASQVTYASPGPGIEMAVNREMPEFLRIDIPTELASLDGIWEAPPSSSSRVILHIQNAHANYGAQKKIQELLEYLNKTYAIKTIFVEGAAEDLNPDYLKLFPDKTRNLELADLLAQQGELTGAELFLLEADTDYGPQTIDHRQKKDSKLQSGAVQAHGIEDADLYRHNYEALKKVFGAEPLVNRYLQGYEARLEALSSKIYPNDLRRVLSDWQKFEKGHREFMPYVRSLAADAKRVLKLDLESLFSQVEWPQITRLLVLQGMEKDLDTAKALEEKDKLGRFLKAKGVSQRIIAEVENFKEQRLSVRQGQGDIMQPRDVLEALVKEASPKGFKFSDYPSFSLYAGYLILKSELDAKELFEEIKVLFGKILDSLAASPNQKALLGLYRDEELARKLLRLELSRKDWKDAIGRKEQLGMDSLISGLKDLSASVTKEMRLAPTDLETKKLSPKFRDEVLGLYNEAFSFYEFARRRESMFYEKIDSVMNRESLSKAVLITGGFHTDGMTDLFREHNVSYGILTPRLMEKSDEKAYRNTMLQNEQQLFSISYLELALKLQSPEIFDAQGFVSIKKLGTEWKNFMQVGRFEDVQSAINVFNRSVAATQADPKFILKLSIAGKNRLKLEKIARSEARWGDVESIEWNDWAWLERNGYPTGEGSIQIHSDNGMTGYTTPEALDAIAASWPARRAAMQVKVSKRSEARWGDVESIEWNDWAWLERNGYPTGEGSIQIHSDNGMTGHTTHEALDAMAASWPARIAAMQVKVSKRSEARWGDVESIEWDDWAWLERNGHPTGEGSIQIHSDNGMTGHTTPEALDAMAASWPARIAALQVKVSKRSEARWGDVESIEWDDWAWLERNGYPTGEGSIQIHSDNGMTGYTTPEALDAMAASWPARRAARKAQGVARSENRTDPRFPEYYREAADQMDGVGTPFGRSMFDIESLETQAQATASVLNRIIEEDGTGELGWEVVNGQVQKVDPTRSETRVTKLSDAEMQKFSDQSVYPYYSGTEKSDKATFIGFLGMILKAVERTPNGVNTLRVLIQVEKGGTAVESYVLNAGVTDLTHIANAVYGERSALDVRFKKIARSETRQINDALIEKQASILSGEILVRGRNNQQVRVVNERFVREQLVKAGFTEKDLKKELVDFLKREGSKPASADWFLYLLGDNTPAAQLAKQKIGDAKVITLNDAMELVIAHIQAINDSQGAVVITPAMTDKLLEEIYPVLLLSFTDKTREITKFPYLFHQMAVTLRMIDNLVAGKVIDTQSFLDKPQWAFDQIFAALHHDTLEDVPTFVPLDLTRYASDKAVRRIQNLTKQKQDLKGLAAKRGIQIPAAAESLVSELQRVLDASIDRASYANLRLGPKGIGAKYADAEVNLRDAIYGARMKPSAESQALLKKIREKIAGNGRLLDELVYHPTLPAEEKSFVDVANAFLARISADLGDVGRDLKPLPVPDELLANKESLEAIARTHEHFLKLLKMIGVDGKLPNEADQKKILEKILHNPDFAREMAKWLNDAYYIGVGQTPPAFIETTDTPEQIKMKVAINLAGFYALEAGIGVLAERSGRTPLDILAAIISGELARTNPTEMLLLARFANATWKASQPFRDIARITKANFIPATLLSDAELAKDFVQITNAAQKLETEMVRFFVEQKQDDAGKARSEARWGDVEAIEWDDWAWLERNGHPTGEGSIQIHSDNGMTGYTTPEALDAMAASWPARIAAMQVKVSKRSEAREEENVEVGQERLDNAQMARLHRLIDGAPGHVERETILVIGEGGEMFQAPRSFVNQVIGARSETRNSDVPPGFGDWYTRPATHGDAAVINENADAIYDRLVAERRGSPTFSILEDGQELERQAFVEAKYRYEVENGILTQEDINDMTRSETRNSDVPPAFGDWYTRPATHGDAAVINENADAIYDRLVAERRGSPTFSILEDGSELERQAFEEAKYRYEVENGILTQKNIDDMTRSEARWSDVEFIEWDDWAWLERNGYPTGEGSIQIHSDNGMTGHTTPEALDAMAASWPARRAAMQVKVAKRSETRKGLDGFEGLLRELSSADLQKPEIVDAICDYIVKDVRLSWKPLESVGMELEYYLAYVALKAQGVELYGRSDDAIIRNNFSARIPKVLTFKVNQNGTVNIGKGETVIVPVAYDVAIDKAKLRILVEDLIANKGQLPLDSKVSFSWQTWPLKYRLEAEPMPGGDQVRLELFQGSFGRGTSIGVRVVDHLTFHAVASSLNQLSGSLYAYSNHADGDAKNRTFRSKIDEFLNPYPKASANVARPVAPPSNLSEGTKATEKVVVAPPAVAEPQFITFGTAKATFDELTKTAAPGSDISVELWSKTDRRSIAMSGITGIELSDGGNKLTIKHKSGEAYFYQNIQTGLAIVRVFASRAEVRAPVDVFVVGLPAQVQDQLAKTAEKILQIIEMMPALALATLTTDLQEYAVDSRTDRQLGNILRAGFVSKGVGFEDEGLASRLEAEFSYLRATTDPEAFKSAIRETVGALKTSLDRAIAARAEMRGVEEAQAILDTDTVLERAIKRLAYDHPKDQMNQLGGHFLMQDLKIGQIRMIHLDSGNIAGALSAIDEIIKDMANVDNKTLTAFLKSEALVQAKEDIKLVIVELEKAKTALSRAEVRVAAGREAMNPADLSVVEEAKLGLNFEAVGKLEARGAIGPVIVAAVAGMEFDNRVDKLKPEQMADVIVQLANASVAKAADWVAAIRNAFSGLSAKLFGKAEKVEILDKPGGMVRLMEATDVGDIRAADLATLANAKQHEAIVLLADGKGAVEKAEKQILEIKQTLAKTIKELNAEKRFMILVLDKNSKPAVLQRALNKKFIDKIASSKEMSAISKKEPGYVVMGPENLLGLFQSISRGLKIKAEHSKNVASRVATSTLASIVSQRLLSASEVDAIREVLNGKKDEKGFYSFSSEALNKMLAIAMQVAQAIQSAA